MRILSPFLRVNTHAWLVAARKKVQAPDPEVEPESTAAVEPSARPKRRRGQTRGEDEDDDMYV